MKSSGDLEKVLATHGVAVKWYEFPFGPPMVEAINTGDIDLGFVGSTPPVFAQAGRAPDIRYVAYSAAYGDNYGIVVPQTSTAKSVRDLKGKRIAVARGSAGQYLLLKALEKNGLKPEDVSFAYLQYSEARSALERGDVAAWVVPDPRLADVEASSGVRVLIRASELPENYGFYIAPRQFAISYPAALRATLKEIDQTEQYARHHLAQTAQFLARDTGVKLTVWRQVLARQPWGVAFPLTPQVIAAQQEVADTFSRYQLLPKAVKVVDAVIDIK
ncbi:aliphatic sulfonate ABC transporter substrate-binding protein [Herbaspirillum sp. RTI4]|uniref:aliphatic sulfonate ABC transporter substrate-binding protein n=1 Tax=Herbaspirillum sp. RTI4 TaxID=3048640 RepID=UPI002AB45319|nr:aliphatic sulfonate ABC transporter substrate-binding protein [Herbaspirillum sp. RTI4]MDY7579952.1 aliphatic sulfonate ABC transporter substrate-binding protein [Herbaspirillum sp. RTI4]MEA9982904.1 aliphatic sulfonate ABC transporter substrate-binding protein [Herbaspirillum sp. RTI4]